ncbi:PHP domain-containing protein [Fodinibius saliphilus]|uniref:PHP domain-containing protein n=1 Tax=Fodinibius saliphilus TaxID=1920650 RepID=UPI001FE27211|nr:PHP domain-containing protein [Fodinibius saliphilus]
MAKADLHIHTVASDGHMQPEDVVRNAKRHKLDIISITDHDTIRGYQKAKEKAQELDIELIPGAEITSDFNGRECHLLAYCFDPDHQEIKRLVARHYHSRLKRGKWILNELSKEGILIDIDEVKAEANGGNIGRPHIAAVLINKGYVASFKEAFIRYLSDESLGTIENEYYTHHEVIETVKKAGGAVIVAHPGNLYNKDELAELVEAGVDGIEYIHPSHSYKTQKWVEAFADEHNLLKTGGSDFHGGDKEYQKFFGVVTINAKYVHRLKRMTDQRKKISVQGL